jgi:hypothetical protein
VTRIQIVFVLTLGRRYVTLIVIGVFFLKTTRLGSKECFQKGYYYEKGTSEALNWLGDCQGTE